MSLNKNSEISCKTFSNLEDEAEEDEDEEETEEEANGERPFERNESHDVKIPARALWITSDNWNIQYEKIKSEIFHKNKFGYSVKLFLSKGWVTLVESPECGLENIENNNLIGIIVTYIQSLVQQASQESFFFQMRDKNEKE